MKIVVVIQREKKCKKKPKLNKSFGYISEITIAEQGSLFINNKIKGVIMALELTSSQQAVGTLSFKDKRGNDTDVADGAVTVSTDDETIATATYDDAKNEVTVKATGAVGVTSLKIKATSQNGSDIPFEDTAIEVKSGAAAQGAVTFGPPTEQEEPST